MELRSKNKVKFKQNFTDTTKVLNSPFYRRMYLWNQLPAHIQQIEEISVFKTNIRALITNGHLKCR